MAFPMETSVPPRQFSRFLGLLAILSAPYYALGAVVDTMLPANLPVSSLMFICPLLATLALTHRASGSAGLWVLLRRTVDPSALLRNLKYLPVLLVVPAVMVVSYWLMRLGGRQLPHPRISLSAVVVGLVVFFVTAVAEEIAWTGYLLDSVRERRGALLAGLLIGGVWAAWHVMPWLKTHSVAWTTGQFVFTVASRVLMVWLYGKAGGSILAVVLLHDLSNVAYTLFPIDGSYYDPLVVGPITAVVTLAVVPSLARQAGPSPRRRSPTTSAENPPGQSSPARSRATSSLDDRQDRGQKPEDSLGPA